MNFLVLGDQSTESFASLRKPYWSHISIARNFLAQANTAILWEVALLSRVDKDRLPELPIQRQHVLQEWVQRQATHPVLRPVFTAVSQCLDLLKYWDTAQTRDPSNLCVLGSCSGLLSAAAAAALPPCPSEWIPLAVQVICIAFRIGLYTASTGEIVARSDGVHESWSSVVQGKLPPKILDEFHSENIPTTQNAYISAVTPNSTTISGPPKTLKTLFSSEPFHATGLSPVPLPVCAPYHAAHLYHAADVEWILGGGRSSAGEILAKYCPRSSVISTKDGRAFVATDMIGLMKQVIHQILNDVLRWDIVVDKITKTVPAHLVVRITAIGAPSLAKSLATALKENKKCEVTFYVVPETPASHETLLHNPESPKIAIVGMSGRFPGAKNTDELWEVLSQGLDLHKYIPPDRFDTTTHVDISGKKKNTSSTPYGCFIDQPGLFDPAFFHMSPREARNTDPMQRLALVCAYEALETSGYVPNRTPSTMLDQVGTFYGQTLDDYREINASQNIDPFYVTGGLRPFGPGRINYYYKFSGPSYSIDTACSSSLAAIHVACVALRNGECKIAVAGGTNIITSSEMYAGLSRGHFLSKTGSCKSFDHEADGYCRADAVGTVILKRLEDAEADNDPILGVILASATNHSAHAPSITQPHGATQEALFRTVIDQAGILPSEVDYVEMHAPGTQIGDNTEMHSVCNVFSSCSQSHSLYVGSIKPNIGHGEAAAGISSVIKGLLMFQKSIIPPHIGTKGGINRQFPSLDDHRIFIPHQGVIFSASQERRRRIMVNNFGAAGGNTTLLLEEPPAKKSAKIDTGRSAYPITVSAKTSISLKMNKEKLANILKNKEISLADLSYTTTSRRQHYRYRFITIASSIPDLERTLLATHETSPTERPRLIFAFTGQGSIYTGVGQEVFRTSRQFRSDILRFDQLAQTHGLPSFLPLLDSMVDLCSLSTVQAQLGQVCVQICLYRLYRSWGISPDAVIGHSLGEYAALYASGVLSASDTILIVGRRAELTEQHCTTGTHSMLAVRTSPEHILEFLDGMAVEIACINGPNDVVLSGSIENIDNAATILASYDIPTTRLSVPFACHSAQLDPVMKPFNKIASTLAYHPPQIVLLSPLLGQEISRHGIIDSHYLVRHMREKVNFVAALECSSLSANAENVQFLELGPHPICTMMIRNVLGHTTIPSLHRGQDAWSSATHSLASLYLRGLDVEWEDYNRDFVSSVSCLSNLPSYTFDESNHWISYEGTWTLNKGSHGVSPEARTESKPRGPATASIQRLVRENFDVKPPVAEFESDINNPALFRAISGHVINGVGLCPSAVFVDMALTAAKYVYESTATGFTDVFMDLVDMEIISPVVVELSGDQKPSHIRVFVKMTREDACTIQFSNSSNMLTKNTSTIYAKCTVILRNVDKVRRKWQRKRRLISSRIADMQSAQGIDRMHNRLVYKLFGAVVNYTEQFHGMDEVLMNGSQFEAVAHVSFKADRSSGDFSWNPYWVDNIMQLSGFVLNANEMIDPTKEVYISNGWESVQLMATLTDQQSYTVYAKMDHDSGSTATGDVYVLDQQVQIVCVVEGIKFQAIPRSLLNILLAPCKGSRCLEQDMDVVPTVGPSQHSSMRTNNKAAISTNCKSSGQESGAISGESDLQDTAQFVLRVLCKEMGVELDEIDRKLTFTELGVDSLMSLTVSGRLREFFDIDLPSNIFQTYNTMDRLGKYLDKEKFQNIQAEVPTPQVGAVAVTNYRATSVLLQGSLHTAAEKLFLFPGGFGTSSTFAPMPSIDPRLAVFGLNSAFVDCPESFNVSIPKMASLYVEEVRRRQPRGPYSFLGYSVGGIIAYEATRQLVMAKEEVQRLYLVDSPCPLTIPPMPPNLIEFLDSIDRFSGKRQAGKGELQEPPKPMNSLHVTRTLISLEDYVPAPLPARSPSPRTTYYVAKQGVNNQTAVRRPKASEKDQKVMMWLLDDRLGLGGAGDGWERLVDRLTLKVVPINGNHFNIMKKPYILEWVEELISTYWN